MKLKLDDKGNVVLQDGKPVYIHDDGKEIAFDAPATVAKIGQLNKEAQGHRERAEAAEAAYKPFKDAGLTDPALAVKALATVKNLDDKKLVDAGEVEKVKAQAIKSVEDKYAPTIEKVKTLESQLNTHLIGGAFAQSKFIAEKLAAEGPAGVEIARALFAGQLKVEDGKVVGYDKSGNKLFSRVRHGELADAEEAIEQMVDAYPHKAHILKGSGAKGGGAQNGNGGVQGGSKTVTRAQFDGYSPTERMAFSKDGGKVVD